jgi:biotin carboxyl carrier protein
MAEEIVEAPMTGRVIRVHAQNGDRVQEGDRICDIEALKMEIPILAPVSGSIKAIHISPGQRIEGGDPLAVIEL